MYEETKSGIDWKGLFLKVIIAFLIVLIAIKGYSTLKGNNNEKNTTTSATAESKSSSTFTANIEKLRNAGEEYFKANKDKLPKEKGNTTMVTLNELVSNGNINALSDEDGKTCDGESSYVTASLEGEKTKIKANLVCGNASSYSLVYMSENDSETADDTVETKNVTVSTNKSNTVTKKTSSNTSSSKSTSCTSNSCATPVVKVSTNTKVSQNVKINGSSTKSNNNTNNNRTDTRYVRKYTVKFDSNGGNKSFNNQIVEENETAYNPGSPYKYGYTFKGWYLDGYVYDFNTPVTKSITLVARYTRNSYDYDDDYDNDYDYDRRTLKTANYTSYVYTMGWDNYGTNYININHTLKLPEYLQNKDIVKAKISNISFYKSLNTSSQARTFQNQHYNTFMYTKSGWESKVYSQNSLSTIRSGAVSFDYSTAYKDLYEALSSGYDVNWTANYVSNQCTSTFSVNGETNKCNYGIVYKVTWKYQYYN